MEEVRERELVEDWEVRMNRKERRKKTYVQIDPQQDSETYCMWNVRRGMVKRRIKGKN